MALSIPFVLQPLGFGALLLGFALLWAIIIALFYSRWIAFLLFLVYIGGLLVIFAYVASLIPNIVFKPRFKPVLTFFFIFPLIYWLVTVKTYSSLNLREASKEGKVYTLDFISWSTGLIFIFLALILFINLIGIVKFCRWPDKTLRPFKYALICKANSKDSFIIKNFGEWNFRLTSSIKLI